MCPQCGRDAPIVYRGVVPYCTACGVVRAPLSGPSVNLAGKPARVGGLVTRVLGWFVVVFGLSVALGVGLLMSVLAPAAVALAVALPIAVLALAIGVVLVRGGRTLERSGTDAERAAREQALLAMAVHNGPMTALDAARALAVDVAQADAILTALAKSDPDRVSVDVDEQGAVWYRVSPSVGAWGRPQRVRIQEPARAADVQTGVTGGDEDDEGEAEKARQAKP